MKRFRAWPPTLAGRLYLILAAGLLLAHGLTLWAVLAERGEAMRGLMLDYAARDLASAVAMLDRLPVAERPDWLTRLDRHNYRLSLKQGEGEGVGSAGKGAPMASALAPALSRRLADRAVAASALPGGQQGLALRLADGAPLSVVLAPPAGGPSTGLWVLLTAQLIVLGLLAALAVRQATQPLARLADAADALPAGGVGEPLPEDGPQEVRRALRAFNALCARIRSHLAERTQILAAVSHDLQTPLTRLRLRADLLEDETLREKLLADVREMEELVREGIAFARGAHGAATAAVPVDLHALLDSLRCDYVDAGQEVTLQAEPGVIVMARPQALRRLITNLVDNAVKFAGSAQVVAGERQGWVYVAVRDEGPGIPQAELQAVQEPFYRLDRSRHRDLGGTGLGLAIARQLVQALGGRLVLSNRPGRGLEALVEFPAPRWPAV